MIIIHSILGYRCDSEDIGSESDIVECFNSSIHVGCDALILPPKYDWRH